RRPGRDRVGVGVVVVLEDPAGHVDRGRAGVEQLDPVAGHAAARLDLVDPDGEAVVGGALRDGDGGAERARPVGAAAVGRDGVARPAVGVNERTARVVEAGGIGAAEPEAEPGLLQYEVAARVDDGRRRDHVGSVRVVVVEERPAGDVRRGRAGIEQLDPVAGHPAARFDLVDHNSEHAGAARIADLIGAAKGACGSGVGGAFPYKGVTRAILRIAGVDRRAGRALRGPGLALIAEARADAGAFIAIVAGGTADRTRADADAKALVAVAVEART